MKSRMLVRPWTPRSKIYSWVKSMWGCSDAHAKLLSYYYEGMMEGMVASTDGLEEATGINHAHCRRIRFLFFKNGEGFVRQLVLRTHANWRYGKPV